MHYRSFVFYILRVFLIIMVLMKKMISVHENGILCTDSKKKLILIMSSTESTIDYLEILYESLTFASLSYYPCYYSHSHHCLVFIRSSISVCTIHSTQYLLRKRKLLSKLTLTIMSMELLLRDLFNRFLVKKINTFLSFSLPLCRLYQSVFYHNYEAESSLPETPKHV